MFNSLGECGDSQFDRVFMFFLLEHIGDPVTFLHEVNRVLKPGGMLFIVVPNVDDALMKLYDIPAFKPFYFTPAHQYYYSRETLTRMLEKAGMNNVSLFPRQRYDLSNHMHWMMNGKPGGAGRYNAVFSKELLAEYGKNLEDHFLCDTLFAVVTKPDL
jgi:SAM-dependent methyltransferase